MSYSKAFETWAWHNKSTARDTPLNATNLQKINDAIDTIDDRVVELDENTVQDDDYVHTDNNFTDSLKSKLNNLPTNPVTIDGAETITGAKTFSAKITGTGDLHVGDSTTYIDIDTDDTTQTARLQGSSNAYIAVCGNDNNMDLYGEDVFVHVSNNLEVQADNGTGGNIVAEGAITAGGEITDGYGNKLSDAVDTSDCMKKGEDYVTAGQLSGSTLGGYATVEGSNNTASGSYSHAEGQNNIAQGNSAHAEGSTTQANGMFSHTQNAGTIASSAYQTAMGKYNAEDTNGTYALLVGNGESNNNRANAFVVKWTGDIIASGDVIDGQGNKLSDAGDISNCMIKGTDYVTAGQLSGSTLGNYATAEGSANTASGSYSHAEGQNNIAQGNSAHAEGSTTQANGSFSHTQNEGTIASSTSQTAIGKYNIEDTNGTYAFLVGNGTNSDRSNAFTIDWDGNIVASGEVTDGYGNKLSEAGGGGSVTVDTALSTTSTNPVRNSVITTALNNKADSSSLATVATSGSYNDLSNLPTIPSTSTFMEKGVDYVTAGQKSGTTLGTSATCEGGSTTGSGYYSHAEGYSTTASGHSSHAEGYKTEAEGNWSHAEGSMTSANGQKSHAEGGSSIANGVCSHSEGAGSEATGENSHAQNGHTMARSADQTAMGRYNVADSSDTYALIIGNGTASARSNALAVDWDGYIYGPGIANSDTVYIAQAYNSSEGENTGGNLSIAGDCTVAGIVTVNGSDYAERFIPLTDCPKSRFVTLDGEMIRLAEQGEYVLGVTSIDPSIVGDARLEGSVEVGLLGKLVVEDDGSCEVNGYCTCGGNGIATKADDGYRVMARIDSTHIKVLVK